MKVDVKTITGDKFSIEIDPSSTVLATKVAIFDLKGDAFEVANQKLIYAGRVLKDESTIAENGVKEGTFLVCMAKPKASAPAAAAAAPAPAAAPAATVIAVRPPVSTAPAAARPPPATELMNGPEADAAVASIMAMGFDNAADVRAALRAAFGNPDRAVEYLFSGIPASAARPAAPAAPAAGGLASAPAGGPSTSGSATIGGGAPANPLADLRQHPQFAQLKALVQRDPAVLESVLAQIGSSSPALLNTINANRTLFVDMMNEPLTAEEAAAVGGDMDDDDEGDDGDDDGDDDDTMDGVPPQLAQIVQAMAGMTPEQRAAVAQQMGIPPETLAALVESAAQGGGGGSGGSGGGSNNVVRLTEPEMLAVERLTSLGFDHQRVIRVFLACNKNEELAENYLLEHIDEQ